LSHYENTVCGKPPAEVTHTRTFQSLQQLSNSAIQMQIAYSYRRTLYWKQMAYSGIRTIISVTGYECACFLTRR